MLKNAKSGRECVDWLLALRPQVAGDGLDGEVRARYWGAVAAWTMSGRIPRALQADAAERAAALYRELGKPRRIYSALIQLAKFAGQPRATGTGMY